MKTNLSIIQLICCLSFFPKVVQASPEVSPSYVEGTELKVKSKKGKIVSGKALIGAIVVGRDESGNQISYRIDDVVKDKRDKDGDIFLYTFSHQDQTGAWQPYCNPDANGIAAGFPLAGSWDKTGKHLKDDLFTITCTSGVLGKCVMMGYKPWKKRPDGESFWDYHQSCTRMLRGDYCGDGIGFTVTGTNIDIMDRIIHSKDDNHKLKFEAAWGPEGAVCLARSRINSPGHTLEDVLKHCPQKLNKAESEKCNLKDSWKNSKALLFNKS